MSVIVGADAIEVVDTGIAGATPPDRVVAALMECVVRWGVQKTTVEDVARAAGMSRATVYRLFPGGKRSMLDAAALTIVMRLVDIACREARLAESQSDALTSLLVSASEFLAADEALQFVLEHDAGAVEAQLALGGLDLLFATIGETVGPLLVPLFGTPEVARGAAIWVARIVASHLMNPAGGASLVQQDVARRIVETYFLPGIYQSSAVPVAGRDSTQV